MSLYIYSYIYFYILFGKATSNHLSNLLKGDGNDGEPDALKKLEMEKKAKNWLELKNCGWLGSYLKNIQSDLPNETRGQS